MTKFDDETLMAYADGELEPGQRAAIEQAMREDPQVAAAVERHRALRLDVGGAFAGILLGKTGPEGAAPAIAGTGGQLVAQGELADALDRQVGGAGGGPARVGVSFAARGGGYCRGFVYGSSAGLACREGREWRIPVLSETTPQLEGGYRQAGSALPPAVLDAIDARIDGAPLDAAGEEAARRRGWENTAGAR